MLVSLPLFAATFTLMMIDFDVLWRYFAWTNQTLAAFTLWAATVYLARHRRFFYICLIPALYMTMVVVTYILVAPTPEGFGIPFNYAVLTAAAVDFICLTMFIRYLILSRSGRLVHDVAY